MPICRLVPSGPRLGVQSDSARIPLLVVEGDLLIDVAEADVESEQCGLGGDEVALGAEAALPLGRVACLALVVEQAGDGVSLAGSDDGVAADGLQEL